MLHTSTGVEYYLAPRRISGALYQRVTTSCVYDLIGNPKALAKPKSANLIFPLESNSKFCGLISRCRTL